METQLVRLAAENTTEAQISAMKKIAEDMKNYGNNINKAVEVDLEFHNILLQASCAKIFVVMLSPLTEIIKQARRKTLIKSRDNANKGHIKIIQSIEKRDPELAAQEIYLHLEQVKEDINPELESN